MVTGVMVEQLTATSVRVSWDEIPVDGITYRVYYSQTGRQSEEFITVPSSDSSVVIEGLLNNVEYQFEVVAIAELDGDVIMGQRSMLIVAFPTTVTNSGYLLIKELQVVFIVVHL